MFSRYLVVCLVAFLLSACTTTFKSIPTTDEDFLLPPEEFVETFPDVKKFQVEKKTSSTNGDYQQLVDVWGAPDLITIDKESKYAFFGWFTAITGAITIQSPEIWLGLVGLSAIIAPPAPEIHKWTKGNYQVEALTHATSAKGKKRLIRSWDWQVKQGENYTPLFEKDKRQLHALFQFRFARGFEDMGDTDVNNPGGGSGLQLELGLEYQDLFKNTDLLFLYGYKTHTLVDHTDNSKKIKVTNNPIQLAALYNLDKRWRIGGGLNYLTNTTLDYNFKEDENLDDALGIVLQVDFHTARQHRFGIAIEASEQDMAGGGSFNSSNFNAYSRIAFW